MIGTNERFSAASDRGFYAFTNQELRRIVKSARLDSSDAELALGRRWRVVMSFVARTYAYREDSCPCRVGAGAQAVGLKGTLVRTRKFPPDGFQRALWFNTVAGCAPLAEQFPAPLALAEAFASTRIRLYCRLHHRTMRATHDWKRLAPKALECTQNKAYVSGPK